MCRRRYGGGAAGIITRRGMEANPAAAAVIVMIPELRRALQDREIGEPASATVPCDPLVANRFARRDI
jgi:hypothetical protein